MALLPTHELVTKLRQAADAAKIINQEAQRAQQAAQTPVAPTTYPGTPRQGSTSGNTTPSG